MNALKNGDCHNILKIETASWTLIRNEKLGKDNRHDCEHNWVVLNFYSYHKRPIMCITFGKYKQVSAQYNKTLSWFWHTHDLPYKKSKFKTSRIYDREQIWRKRVIRGIWTIWSTSK